MFADLLTVGRDSSEGLSAKTLETRLSEVVSAGSGGRPIDGVLFWNLLNYLEPEAITAMMSWLTGHLSRGAVLHLLTEYAASRIPDPPARLVPLSTEHLRIDVQGPGTLASPGYTAGDIQRFMRGLSAERTVLLANGMQEFLFRKR